MGYGVERDADYILLDASPFILVLVLPVLNGMQVLNYFLTDLLRHKEEF